MFAVSHVTVSKQTGEAAVVFVLEFLATNADGTSRTIEIVKQRAKTNSLIEEKAKVLMKDAAFRQGRPDLCVIKNQMGQVHGQVVG
jgi:hypothetical protein